MGSGSGEYNSGTAGGSVATVLGALGTMLGYMGTEISVNDLFERLLWPQRYYHSPSAREVWKIALMMPMGGPLHKAALRTLDTFYKKGLFRGGRCGHMLGTAFFGDTERTYRLYRGEGMPTSEHVRNGMWVRVIDQMPMLLKDAVSSRPQQEEAIPLNRRVRQQIAVSHLHLRRAGAASLGPTIDDYTNPISFRTIAWVVITESSGIAVSIAVAIIWKSALMLLWLLPLFLKLLSACLCIKREGLATISKQGPYTGQGRSAKFEILTNGNGFQVIQGEESLVLQFFRHFGHPIRCRKRENIQIAVVVAFALLFPVGLLCSLLWMPTGMQCIWLSYQLYATVVLHIYHFVDGQHWTTTEEKIAREFRNAEVRCEDAQIRFGRGKEKAIHATLVRTSHDNFAEGQAHVERLLSATYFERQDSDSGSPTPSTSSKGSTLVQQALPEPSTADEKPTMREAAV